MTFAFSGWRWRGLAAVDRATRQQLDSDWIRLGNRSFKNFGQSSRSIHGYKASLVWHGENLEIWQAHAGSGGATAVFVRIRTKFGTPRTYPPVEGPLNRQFLWCRFASNGYGSSKNDPLSGLHADQLCDRHASLFLDGHPEPAASRVCGSDPCQRRTLVSQVQSPSLT
jgi:hypothetical protein